EATTRACCSHSVGSWCAGAPHCSRPPASSAAAAADTAPRARRPRPRAAPAPPQPMGELWSPERKVRLERELWVAVMQAQRDLGVDIPAEAIDDYRAIVDAVDLASIG